MQKHKAMITIRIAIAPKYKKLLSAILAAILDTRLMPIAGIVAYSKGGNMYVRFPLLNSATNKQFLDRKILLLEAPNLLVLSENSEDP